MAAAHGVNVELVSLVNVLTVLMHTNKTESQISIAKQYAIVWKTWINMKNNSWIKITKPVKKHHF